MKKLNKKSESKNECLIKDKFILFTIIIAAVLGSLFIWKGIKTGFTFIGIAVVSLNFLYIPIALIFREAGFTYFYLIYSVILVFATAFEKSFLFNNYTALFVACIVIGIQPKLKKAIIVLYFIVVSVAFAINEEAIYHYLIHIFRSLWFIGIVDFVISDKYKIKKLVLYEDERNILEQLCQGKVYQKEVEGFSENTIYRKLKAARERNGNVTREELIEAYREEKNKMEEN